MYTYIHTFHNEQANPCNNCLSYCGFMLTTPYGVLTDGSNQFAYGNNVACQWIIAPPNSTQLTLKFFMVNTESCCDFVRVWECPDTACITSTLLATLSGASYAAATRVISSATGIMLVQFVTDDSVTADGFWAEWNAEPWNFQTTVCMYVCMYVVLIRDRTI
jgi:hypothetical protein